MLSSVSPSVPEGAVINGTLNMASSEVSAAPTFDFKYLSILPDYDRLPNELNNFTHVTLLIPDASKTTC